MIRLSSQVVRHLHQFIVEYGAFALPRFWGVGSHGAVLAKLSRQQIVPLGFSGEGGQTMSNQKAQEPQDAHFFLANQDLELLG